MEALAAEKEATDKDDTGGANDSSDDDSNSEPGTPTNGNMSSDEVDSDAASMPVTPGRDILPLSESSHNLLPAAFRSLERLNEENEEEEKMVGVPATASRSV